MERSAASNGKKGLGTGRNIKEGTRNRKKELEMKIGSRNSKEVLEMETGDLEWKGGTRDRKEEIDRRG